MSRVIRRAAGAALLCGALLGVSALPASAAQVNCTGSSITGDGASFQNNAQALWINNFTNTTTIIPPDATLTTNVAGFCLPTSPFIANSQSIVYGNAGAGRGSGAGRRVFDSDGAADTTPIGGSIYRENPERYAAFDEAPNATELANMDEGDPSTTADNGTLATVPVGVGAITISVNVPNGCTWNSGYQWKADAVTNTTRFIVPNSTWEKAFAGEITNWGGLFPDVVKSGKTYPGFRSTSTAATVTVGGLSVADTTCRTFPTTRAVRADGSGTTFGFKEFLFQLNGGARAEGGTTWDQSAKVTPNNIGWPSDTGTTGGAPIQRGSGNPGVADKIVATDGAIGYVELGTARTKGLGVTPTTVPANKDDVFWVPLVAPNGTSKVEPALASTSYKQWNLANPADPGIVIPPSTDPSFKKGAKCGTAQFLNLPLDYTGLFNNVVQQATGGTTADWPICTLTYAATWQNAAKVYGFNPTESAKANTVINYFKEMTGPNGQKLLPTKDFAKVPTTLLNTYSKPAVTSLTYAP